MLSDGVAVGRDIAAEAEVEDNAGDFLRSGAGVLDEERKGRDGAAY